MKALRDQADKDAARQLRDELMDAVARGEMTIQAAVRQMRKIARMTQEEFADHRGVSVKVIKDLERGIGNPTVATLNKIGQFFGLEVAYVRKNMPAKPAAQITAPLTDLRRLMEELDAIKRLAAPPPGMTEALKDMRAELEAMLAASRVLEQQPNVAPELMHADLGAATRRIAEELQAVEEARKILQRVEHLQQQLQPPPEYARWLQDVEMARKYLDLMPPAA